MAESEDTDVRRGRTYASRPIHFPAARPDDYDAIAWAVDDWWERPVQSLLPRLFLDHFHATSLVAEEDSHLTGFLVGFVSPSEPELAYIHFVGVSPANRH